MFVFFSSAPEILYHLILENLKFQNIGKIVFVKPLDMFFEFLLKILEIPTLFTNCHLTVNCKPLENAL